MLTVPVPMMRYSIVDGELYITDPEQSQVIWRGAPDGMRVEKVFPVPGSGDCVALLEYREGMVRTQNVVRVSPDGRVVWRSELPEDDEPDAYVRVTAGRDGVNANSWSGYHVVLNFETGRIEKKTFAK